jgi:hypothetical protein
MNDATGGKLTGEKRERERDKERVLFFLENFLFPSFFSTLIPSFSQPQ